MMRNISGDHVHHNCLRIVLFGGKARTKDRGAPKDGGKGRLGAQLTVAILSSKNQCARRCAGAVIRLKGEEVCGKGKGRGGRGDGYQRERGCEEGVVMRFAFRSFASKQGCMGSRWGGRWLEIIFWSRGAPKSRRQSLPVTVSPGYTSA